MATAACGSPQRYERDSIVPLMQSASWESADEAFAAINEALQRATELQLLSG